MSDIFEENVDDTVATMEVEEDLVDEAEDALWYLLWLLTTPARKDVLGFNNRNWQPVDRESAVLDETKVNGNSVFYFGQYHTASGSFYFLSEELDMNGNHVANSRVYYASQRELVTKLFQRVYIDRKQLEFHRGDRDMYPEAYLGRLKTIPMVRTEPNHPELDAFILNGTRWIQRYKRGRHPRMHIPKVFN
jgi:hypothetical protein